MANPEHVEVVRGGLEAIREWLKSTPFRLRRSTELDLTKADLSHLDLSDSPGLAFADMSEATLVSTRMAGTHLRCTKLRQAKLASADLRWSKLDSADLTSAQLQEAQLDRTVFLETKLDSADLSGAFVGDTMFADVDLSGVRGLEAVNHRGPSHIAANTLIQTAAGLAKDPTNQPAVETFFRGAGLEEHAIEYFRSLIGRPIEFYTCFISYSHTDKSFAERLYAQLQARGVRPFKDDKDMKVGDEIRDVVNRQIRLKDKVILCCSEASLNSQWVKDELDIAFEKEADGSRVILPLNLDGYLFDGWEDGRGAKVRTRLAANFKGWDTDNAVFERELERVIEALRAG